VSFGKEIVKCFGGYIGISMGCADIRYMYFDSGVTLAQLKQDGTETDVYGYIGLTNAVMMDGYDWINHCGLC
jgi:hypothetical protein